MTRTAKTGQEWQRHDSYTLTHIKVPDDKIKDTAWVPQQITAHSPATCGHVCTGILLLSSLLRQIYMRHLAMNWLG